MARRRSENTDYQATHAPPRDSEGEKAATESRESDDDDDGSGDADEVEGEEEGKEEEESPSVNGNGGDSAETETATTQGGEATDGDEDEESPKERARRERKARGRGKRRVTARPLPNRVRAGRARRSAVEDEDSTTEDLLVGARAGEPDPLESMPERSPFLKVHREKANGPSSGFPDGDDYVGPCGVIPRRWEFEQKIREKWGGGDYEVSGIGKGGKLVTKAVTIGGPSKSVDPPLEGSVFDSSIPRNDGFAARGPSFYGSVHAPSNFGPSFGGHPGPGYGFPHPFPSPSPPFTSPLEQQANAYRSMRSFGADEEARMREERMRAELDQSKEREREAREAAKIETIRRETEAREAAHKAEMDRVVAEVKSNRPDESWRERAEQERLEREKRWEEERIERERRREEEDKKRQEERDRWEREWRDRKEREDREWKERKEKEEREEKARAEESRRAEKSFDRMVGLMQANQMKPADMMGMLAQMKQLGGGGDVTEQFLKIAQGYEALKDSFGGGSGGDDESPAERLVSAAGEALTPLVSEVGKIMESRSKAQTAPPPQQGSPQVVYAPVAGYPGYLQPIHVGTGLPAGPAVHQTALMPAPQHPAMMMGYQQPQYAALPGPPPQTPEQQMQVQVNAGAAQVEAAHGEVTARQWGKVLEHIVDAAIGQAHPAETAQHLLTTLKAIDALPALQQLAEAKVPSLKGKVNLLLLSGRVKDPHFIGKMQTFVKIAGDPNGSKWIEAVLAELCSLYAAVQQLATQRRQQQQQQQRAPQPPPPPPPPPAAQQHGPPQVATPPQVVVYPQQPAQFQQADVHQPAVDTDVGDGGGGEDGDEESEGEGDEAQG